MPSSSNCRARSLMPSGSAAGCFTISSAKAAAGSCVHGTCWASREAEKKAGAPVIQIGNFIQVVFEFTIVAFVVFLVVKQINRLTAKHQAAPPPDKKECPQCLAQIPIKATRCMYCTQ